LELGAEIGVFPERELVSVRTEELGAACVGIFKVIVILYKRMLFNMSFPVVS
jgi:hypothetical protein